MRHRLYKFQLLVFLLFTFGVFDSLAVKHIGKQEGLSNKRTFSLQKDSTGFIWIATKSGIDRYDGSAVKQYKLLSVEKRDNLAGRINKLAKDKLNVLWAYTNDGQLFRYDDLQDRYVLQLNLCEHIDNLAVFVNGISFFDEEHVFVYGSFGLGVYDFQRKEFSLVDRYRDNNVLIVSEIDTLTYAIGTQTELWLSFFYMQDDSLQEKISKKIPIKERIQCMNYESEADRLFIGTFVGRLYVYDIRHQTIERHPYDFKATIRDIERLEHTIYVGTDGGGLFHFNEDSCSVHDVIRDFQDERPDNRPYAIYDLLLDDDRIWVATYTNGVYVYDKNMPPFKSLQFRDPDEKLDNSVNAVIEDSSGKIWLGTNQGISVYDTSQKTWKHLLNPDENNVARHNILTLCEDKYGTVWAGGIMGETATAFDARTLAVKKHLSLPNESKNNRTYHIFNDSDGFLWFGGLYGKLARYNPLTGNYEQYGINYVNVIYEKNTKLFVGTTCGLYVFDRTSNLFTQLLGLDRLSKMQSFINTIYVDEQECIWLGTEEGLIGYNSLDDSIVAYDMRNGLPANSIYAICPDGRKRLWLSSEKGLVCFDVVKKSFSVYGIEEGLLDDNFKVRAACCKRNGELMFGTANGVVYFRPEYTDKPHVNTKLVITDFAISYDPVYPMERKSPLSDVVDKIDQLTLKYNQNTFSFRFACINYTNPGRNVYEWMLEGYDKDWIRRENEHAAYYTNVPHGKYVFKLKVLNKDNQEQLDARSIQIRIKPPIWATLVAKILYVVVFFWILWLIVQYVRVKIEKSNIAEKIQFFTNTAHELKTPVALIKGPLNKLQESSSLSRDESVLLQLAINNTNRLHRIVMQLLDLQKAGTKSLKLFLAYCDIVEFVNMKSATFHALASDKDIKLTVMPFHEELYAWIDMDKLDKIFNNLMSNALKYTGRGGEVVVLLQRSKSNWSLTIADDGIGIPVKNQKDIFKPFFRADNANVASGTGIGLSLTRNLVSCLGGEIKVKSMEGVGSSFTVILPLDYKTLSPSQYVLLDKTDLNESTSQHEENLNQDIPSNRKGRLLLVDDNRDMRVFLRQSLAEKYVVFEAGNGQEALAAIKKANPEIIISDVMMPEMDGYELCHKIKSCMETSHIPVILLTALDDRKNIQQGYAFGADNYIVKPFDISILILTIENTIATRRALRKNLIMPIEGNGDGNLEVNPLDKDFLDRVIAVIKDNIDDSEFSIDSLSREMAMSRSSFFNKLKAVTGHNPNSFIRMIRLNCAIEMLKEKKYTIAEVSYSVGFNDVKYFSTVFKKHFGVSPSKLLGD